MEKFQLTFKKLCGLTTDGAPAMVVSKKGLVAFGKKEMNRLSLDTNDLIVCHCIVHQEKSLCTVVATKPCDVNNSVMDKFCDKQRA